MSVGTNIVRGKVWGNTNTLFFKNNVEIARIEVKKGGYCSRHMHKHKYNLFFLEKGSLEITIYRHDANTELEDVTLLKETGDTTYVEPGVYHKFNALEDSIAYEIYWVDIGEEDIVRDVVGGIIRPGDSE